MEHYRIGDRLGGAHCELYCRKENICSSLQINPFTGKKCVRVELSRNSTSEVSKAFDLSDEELNSLIEKHNIHHKLGDRLVAEAITVYIDQRRPIRFTVKEGATHRNGARFASTVTPTFSEIKYAQEHIRNAEFKRLESLKKLENK